MALMKDTKKARKRRDNRQEVILNRNTSALRNNKIKKVKTMQEQHTEVGFNLFNVSVFLVDAEVLVLVLTSLGLVQVSGSGYS